jgi:ATP-binding cassette subfamily B protein RaxB
MNPALDLGFWRRSRIRPVRQTELSECGLASLTMIANFHGSNTDLRSMRDRFPPSLRGVTLKALMMIADQIGLMPRAVKLPLEQISQLSMPAVLHWDLNHFVVVERVAGKRGALIHDPAGQSRWYTNEQLSPHFTGVALELRAAFDFQRAPSARHLKLSQLWHRIGGLKRTLAQVLALTLVLQMFVLVSPYYMQIAVDSAVPALDSNLLSVLAIGFGLLVLLNTVASFFRKFVLLAAGTSLGFGLTSNIGRHLLRLPLDWFERRHVGDILSRFQSVIPIQMLLTEDAVGAVVDGTLVVLTFAVMLFYSFELALVALAALGLYALTRLLLLAPLREALSSSIVARAIEQTNMIESIRSIATLRLFNRETIRHVDWQSKLTASANAAVHVSRISIMHTTANSLLFGSENVVTVYLAVGMVIHGGFTVGMLFAYFAYKAQFLATAQSLIDRTIEFRMLAVHLERLSDIAMAKPDPSFGPSADAWNEFHGEIEVTNLVYRYSVTDPWVLNGVDFRVTRGEHVVITGPSGGGKSTLAKILLGLIEPTAGSVLVDGKPLSQFGYKSYHEQVAAVLQEDNLFLGSIADNIALFDERRDMDRIENAARAAAIHDEIVTMPMSYQTLIGNMGASLSGGQKQRILLARALHRQPKLLIMDEGTAHLDLENEVKVNDAIRRLGITRIIIAHRRETVTAAQRVITLRGGRICEPN